MSGSLSGSAITSGRVQVPAWGRPWADVALSEPVEFAIGSIQTLTIADVSISMVVVSGGALHGKAGYRLVGGKGKWGATIPRKSYMTDSNVKTATVLLDAATACGETIADLPTSRLGTHYARPEGPASDVLNQLAPRNWYVDFTGTTRIGQRPTTTYAGDAPRVRVDTTAGIIELAVESLAGLVPGVVVDGLAQATDVEFVLKPERLTARVWGGPAATSRRVSALLKIVQAETARYRYAGSYEFRVVTQSGERLNLQPVRVAMGFGDLSNVPVRPGVAGCRADVTLGELVMVTFADLDPSRPYVYAHSHADDPAWMPLFLELGGPGALGVARVTDPVQAGPYAGVITAASARVKASV